MALQPIRIPSTIPPFVMVTNDTGHIRVAHEGMEDICADRRMLPDVFQFRFGQTDGPVKNVCANGQFSDVVELGNKPEASGREIADAGVAGNKPLDK